MHDFHAGGHTIESGIGARDRHGAAIDVTCEHRPVKRLRSGDGEDAGAGADVEDGSLLLVLDLAAASGDGIAARPALSTVSLHDPIEREQASARACVMAGAEGKTRLDLDGDAVDPDPIAVMCAVHQETPRLDRRQTFETLAHPVRGCE